MRIERMDQIHIPITLKGSGTPFTCRLLKQNEFKSSLCGIVHKGKHVRLWICAPDQLLQALQP